MLLKPHPRSLEEGLKIRRYLVPWGFDFPSRVICWLAEGRVVTFDPGHPPISTVGKPATMMPPWAVWSSMRAVLSLQNRPTEVAVRD
jgi:hypothetical protein